MSLKPVVLVQTNVFLPSFQIKSIFCHMGLKKEQKFSVAFAQTIPVKRLSDCSKF